MSHRRRHELLRLRRCPDCGYDLTGLPAGHRCPECGAAFDRGTILIEGVATGETRIGRDAWALGMLLFGLVVALGTTRLLPVGSMVILFLAVFVLVTVATIVRKRQVARTAGGDVHLLLTDEGLARREHSGMLHGAAAFTAWKTTPWSSIARVRIVPHRNFALRRCRDVTVWRLAITLRLWKRLTSYSRLRPIILRMDARKAAALRSEMRRRIAAAR